MNSAARQLEEHLAHLFGCLRRHISRHGFRMVQASGTLSNLYVSLAEAQALLGDGTLGAAPTEVLSGVPPPEEIEEEVNAEWLRLKERWAGPVHADLPLQTLRLRFHLSERQLRLLLAAAGPMLSVDLARLYTFAWADFAVKRPSVGFLCELLADTPGEVLALHEEFAGDAPLVRHRLVELRDEASWGSPTPLLHRAVLVPDPVVEFLRGQRHDREQGANLPARLSLACSLSREAPPRDRLLYAEDRLDDIAAVLALATSRGRRGRPRLLLTGPPGTGRRSALASVLAPMGWGVLTVDLARLSPEDDEWADRLAEACREALLRRSLLLLRGDTLFDDTERWTRLQPALNRIVDPYEGPLAVTTRYPAAGLHRLLGDLYDVPVRLPSTAQQRRMWELALEGFPTAPEVPEQLARRFSLSPGIVHDAVQEARARAEWLARGGEVPQLTIDDAAKAVRKRLDHTLSQVAEPFTTTLTWDDVVLPTEVMDALKEILSQAKNRERVYDDWGFRQKMAYGRGLACLFAGPPGTGKTMMAGILAKQLGQEIYRVDISRVVSKWVGETEKNLARVFDEAESAQVILLFDEADSLFSARTKVEGSNDRFANMEINYLLQRMESYDGMSILTTNFEKAIDEAFKRRLKFRLNFPLPEVAERVQLWKSMLPKKANVAEGVKFEMLGKKYTMAGGNIKNAVLRAAFYAAEDQGIITHELLEKAAIAEAREMGKLI